VVIGIGLNISMTADQLPVTNATSLSLQGVSVGRDDVLAGLLAALGTRYDQLLADEGSLRADYVATCGTVGCPVRVSLPDGSAIEGEATDVDALGRLVVDGNPVTAGDVLHVRA